MAVIIIPYPIILSGYRKTVVAVRRATPPWIVEPGATTNDLCSSFFSSSIRGCGLAIAHPHTL
ncbi:MAG: hypothetical protein F6K54_10190 [Okeania sp. SIO3B5]|uniref:hypothetical protein n=1 Tax=Okeania sp. SIO3B5 TaxID=2607811 RepID=UPI0013FF424E|nr:hypothetical protein [Okeania sp. SIO3B5]NEO53420.1 hypothetical protein [Okeania sp. SIO3B5]